MKPAPFTIDDSFDYLTRVQNQFGQNRLFGKTKALIAAGLLVAFFSLNAIAQDYTIKGTVRTLERDTGKRLENVMITGDNFSYNTKTDVEGNYTLQIPAGGRNIKFLKEGYLGIEKNLNIKSDTTINASLPDTNLTTKISTERLTREDVREWFEELGTEDVMMFAAIPKMTLQDTKPTDSVKFLTAKNDIETTLERTIGVMANEPSVIFKIGYYNIRFNTNGSNTQRWNEAGEIIFANSNLPRGPEIRKVYHELMRGLQYVETVWSRSSVMNIGGSSIGMQPLDWALLELGFRQRDAKQRGEQSMPLRQVSEYIQPQQLTPATIKLNGKYSDSTFFEIQRKFTAERYNMTIKNLSTQETKDTVLNRIIGLLKLEPYTQYQITVTAENALGKSAPTITHYQTASSTGRIDDFLTPETFKVSPAYPNPTNGQVNLPVMIAGSAEVEIKVYTLTGQVVSVQRRRIDQSFVIPVQTGTLSSGLYQVQVISGGQSRFIRFVLVK